MFDPPLSSASPPENYQEPFVYSSSMGRGDSIAEANPREEDPHASEEASIKERGDVSMGAIDDGDLASPAPCRGYGGGDQPTLPLIKPHQLYTLRRNPKPSKRLRSQEPPPLEMVTPSKTAKEETHQCMECGKGFVSSRALAGHMRCHPERQWRGIHCPTGKAKHLQSKAKKPQSWSSSQGQESPSHTTPFDAADTQSDAESIEAAYMSANFKQNLRSWRTGKRSKQRRWSPRVVTCQEFELGPHPPDGKGVMEEMDMANCLVMLAYAGQVQGNEEEGMGWKGSAQSRKAVTQENGDNVEFAKAREDQREGEDNGKLRFECETCKRVFKSCQALGGHRASHKTSKGRETRAYDPNKGSPCPEEELTKEDPQNRRQTDLQVRAYKIALNAQDGMPYAKHRNRPHSQRIKPHECSICHKTFQSGQALGGHKRYHWEGAAFVEMPFGRKQRQAETAKCDIHRDEASSPPIPPPKDSADADCADLNGAFTSNHIDLLKAKSKFNPHTSNSFGDGEPSKRGLPRITASCDPILEASQKEVSSTQNLILDDHADPSAFTPWYVKHNLCDQVSSSIATFNHQRDLHTNSMDSTAGLTSIST